MEITLQSFEPFAYTVATDFSTFENQDLENAFKKNDEDEIKLQRSFYTRFNYLVFLSIKNLHASVWLIPYKSMDVGEETLKPVNSIVVLPLKDEQICFNVQLQFESMKQRKYKITRYEENFINVKHKTYGSGKTYFIGFYEKINSADIQLAAMRSAPHTYSILFYDCVRFAKDFCANLLFYVSNKIRLDKQVNSNLSRITASGLKIEQLSREVETFGYTGNVTIASPDITTYLGNRNFLVWIFCGIFIFLIWPIIIVFAIKYFDFL